MDGLEHGIALADVSAACGADAALEFGCFVGYDVAVEIGRINTLKSVRRFLSMSFAVVMSIYQSSVVISGYSLPISLQRLKFSVGGFDDVGLGYDRYTVFVIFLA